MLSAEDLELSALTAKLRVEILASWSAAKRPGESSPASVELTGASVRGSLADHPRAVVDVRAPSCGPCRAFAPAFATVAHAGEGSVGFGELHADHEPKLVTRFGVRALPCLLSLRSGELVRTEVGVTAADPLPKPLRKVFRDRP